MVASNDCFSRKDIEMTETFVDGMQLHIAEHGHGGPVIFWGMYPHQEHEVEHLWEELLEIVSENDFLLVAFQVEDWNRDFTLGSTSSIWNRKICRTRQEYSEMANRGMYSIY